MSGIKAIEYEAFGLEDEDISNTNIKYFDPDAIVGRFLYLFLQEENFNKIIVINKYKYLRNRKEYGIDRETPCRIFKDRQEVSEEVVKRSCISHGHLSILFVPNKRTHFFNQYFQIGFFKAGKSLEIGTGLKGDLFGISYLSTLLECLQVAELQRGDLIYTFSHDANYLYEITYSDSL